MGSMRCVRKLLLRGLIMARKEELGKDTEGRYRRYLGWKQGNGRPIQHLFRLGRDEAQAKAANYRLEQLWDAVVARWRRWKADGKTDDPCPLWDDATLAIGHAIAKGQSTCTLYPPEGLGATGAATWLAVLQTQFPMIGLTLPEKVKEEGVVGLKENVEKWNFYRRLDEAALSALGEVTGQTVHQALDAYSAYLTEKYKGGADRPHQASVRLLKQHVDDLALSKLDADRIDTWLAYWCARPASKDAKKEAGTPLAFTTCRNVLIVLRQFLRWLNRSQAFDWTLRHDFPRCRIGTVPADRAKKRRRRFWTVDELKTLWQYAKPWERALMCLGLNCGFNKAEISTLHPSETVKGKKYTFVKRDRQKTGAYGEWVLWPETLEALAYLTQFRKPGEADYVVVNTAGNPLNKKTPTGNENQVIKNHWDNLMKRVRTDHPDFHILPFSRLRKTAANFIRHMNIPDATELAVMMTTHTERMDGGDDQLAAYTDRPWKKLHRALLRLRKKLLPVLSSVPEPWVYKMNTISPVTRLKVVALRNTGMTLKAIAAEVGLHEMTVGKICRGQT